MTASTIVLIQFAAACGASIHVELLTSATHAERILDTPLIQDKVNGCTYLLAIRQEVQMSAIISWR